MQRVHRGFCLTRVLVISHALRPADAQEKKALLRNTGTLFAVRLTGRGP